MVTKHEYEQCAIRNRRLLMLYENCRVNFVRRQAMWSFSNGERQEEN
jgi:hypothetical protein